MNKSNNIALYMPMLYSYSFIDIELAIINRYSSYKIIKKGLY